MLKPIHIAKTTRLKIPTMELACAGDFYSAKKNPTGTIFWLGGSPSSYLSHTYRGKIKQDIEYNGNNTYAANLTRGKIRLKPTTCYRMFYMCSGLTSLNLSHFNTQNTKNMYEMFSGCSGLTSLDLSSFNTQNVTTMYKMFYGDSALKTLDASSFVITSAVTIEKMFSGCLSLTTLDLSGFSTSNITSTLSLFYGCSSLSTLDLSNLDMSGVTTTTDMFYGCIALTSIKVTNCNAATKQKLINQLATNGFTFAESAGYLVKQ